MRWVSLFAVCSLFLVVAQAALYDKKRGFKTYNLPQGDVQKFLKDHDPSTMVNRHAHKEQLEKEHPEVKRFHEWRQKHKEGHETAGAAFAGKIPHEYIPHLADPHEQPRKGHGHAGHHHRMHHHKEEL